MTDFINIKILKKRGDSGKSENYHFFFCSFFNFCEMMPLVFWREFMKYDVMKIKSTHYDDPKSGGLSFFESERDIPFAVRRIYWIYEAEKGTHRGFHAHTLNWQILFCPYGSIDIILDDGKEKETVTLDEPSKGLILHPGLWREMIWNKTDSVLCVAASEYYDPDEYIRDYDAFLEFVNKKNNS